MNRPKWLAVGALLMVFALGTVTGGAAMAAWHGKQRRDVARVGFGLRGERPLMAMARRLDLSPEQRRSIDELLERHGPKQRVLMQDMMLQCGQAMQEEKAKLDGEIRAILSPEQQKQFDELSLRQRERMFGSPGPRPGRGH